MIKIIIIKILNFFFLFSNFPPFSKFSRHFSQDEFWRRLALTQWRWQGALTSWRGIPGYGGCLAIDAGSSTFWVQCDAIDKRAWWLAHRHVLFFWKRCLETEEWFPAGWEWNLEGWEQETSRSGLISPVLLEVDLSRVLIFFVFFVGGIIITNCWWPSLCDSYPERA